ncbi:MAG: hypothetical protein AB7P21_25450 [Lautropia sp.]
MNSPTARVVAVAFALACVLPVAARAQPAGQGTGPKKADAAGSGVTFGLVLDGGFSSDDLALGERERGFGLGHTELTASGNIDDRFLGRATAALHAHDGAVEVELEEAFVETLTLPAGLTARGGRFLSQIGYLNEQHPHADDFVTRPLLYRAFLGSHYYDDGLRLNWTAPTALYWRVGVELLGGRQLVPEAVRSRTLGAVSLSTKLGGDIGPSQSWQLGLGVLHNRLEPIVEEEAAGALEAEHDHAHGSSYVGRNLFIADAVWKWAPEGNNRERQVRLSAEYARVTKPSAFATSDDFHEAWYVSAVYRFAPQWEAGLRYGQLSVREPHDDHFHDGRLREVAAMIAWKRSHFSVLRLQFTTQSNAAGFPDAGKAVMLQYVMSLGGHGAHSY